jgi:hypothetical protein
MARATGRTIPCTPVEARRRLEMARSALTIAEVAATGTAPGDTNTAVSNAVMAGIAAADAITGLALGERSRSQSHAAAVDLLARVAPDGRTLARDLQRLLTIKDDAQYSDRMLKPAQATTAIRQATTLVNAAAERATR